MAFWFAKAATLGLTAALGALLVVGDAGAQTAAPPNSNIEVLGLRTGMTEAELRKALGAAGFAAKDTPIGSQQGSSRTGSSRLVLNQFDETEFLSSIVSRKSGKDLLDDTVLVAFLPYGNETRAWAISRIARYLPGKGPSQGSILLALAEKYGPSADVKANSTVHWWWDAAGNPLPPKARPECERAIHDTQMVYDNTGQSTTNLAALRAPPFPGIARAECAYGLRAQVSLDASGNAGFLAVLAVALKDANDGAMITSKLVGQLTANAQQKARAAADARKPDL